MIGGKKRYKEKKGAQTRKKMKAIRLTSHATAMDLVIQFPGDRVVPGQRFRQITQFLMSTASEEGAETFMTHREVAKQLQHVKQDRNGYRVQNNRLQRAHHLDQQH